MELDLHSIPRKDKGHSVNQYPDLGWWKLDILTWSYKATGHIDLAPYILWPPRTAQCKVIPINPVGSNTTLERSEHSLLTAAFRSKGNVQPSLIPEPVRDMPLPCLHNLGLQIAMMKRKAWSYKGSKNTMSTLNEARQESSVVWGRVKSIIKAPDSI